MTNAGIEENRAKTRLIPSSSPDVEYCPNVHMARVGLEPTRLAAQAPKTCVSANSTTGPLVAILIHHLCPSIVLH